MRASRKRIDEAKAAIVRRMADETWLKGVGIGLVNDGPGIIVSVAADGEEAAREILSGIDTDVPTRVQVLGPIRKRRD
jgi:hypothetical protein